MKAVVPGYLYALKNLDDDGEQPLQFIQKEKKGDAFATVVNGTSNEEVTLVLIDRLKFLDERMPDPLNQFAIQCLEMCLAACRLRTSQRMARGVEGTPKP